MNAVKERQQQRQQWLAEQWGEGVPSLQAVAAGASNRCFFRGYQQQQPFILMDAPTSLQSNQRFIQIARDLRNLGLNVPEIYAYNLELGLVLMSDLGECCYYQQLSDENVDHLYALAMTALLTLQQSSLSLPRFDRVAMMIGLQGFESAFLERYLGLKLNNCRQRLLHDCFEFLINNALTQPQVAMHRDYHSQNLLLDHADIGIVDFQDAKLGPITYDLVSLLRDCYVAWPKEQVDDWRNQYHQNLLAHNLLSGVSRDQFQLWFDLMGMKRHLKACFTFARKFLDDGDASYLQHLPRTLHYIAQACQDHPQLHDFNDFFCNEVLASVDKQ